MPSTTAIDYTQFATSIPHIYPLTNDESPDLSAKRHAACDECRGKKLKCTGEQPKCSRCVKKNIDCIYALQKTMGRPRKKRLLSGDDMITNDVSSVEEVVLKPSNHLGVWTLPKGPAYLELNADSFSQRGFGTPLMPDIALNDDGWPILDPGLPELLSERDSAVSPTISDLTESPSFSTPGTSANGSAVASNGPTSSAEGTIAPCACLSQMYLCMSALQNMTDFSFPSALFTIRQNIKTAFGVLHCQECPKAYFTAFQNVQLLGMCLVGMAERYCKVLDTVDSTAAAAVAEARTLNLRVGDMNGSNTHLHSANPDECISHFNVDLLPSQWKTLVKDVVKGEVKGSPLGCCPSYRTLLEGLEARQGRWHMTIPAFRCPRPYTAEEIAAIAEKKQVSDCLRLVNEARKIIDHMKFD